MLHTGGHHTPRKCWAFALKGQTLPSFQPEESLWEVFGYKQEAPRRRQLCLPVSPSSQAWHTPTHLSRHSSNVFFPARFCSTHILVIPRCYQSIYSSIKALITRSQRSATSSIVVPQCRGGDQGWCGSARASPVGWRLS